MTPATVTLENHTEGDLWQGIPTIGPVTINDAQPALTLDRIRIQFRKKMRLGFTLDSNGTGDALITITNATTWEATVGEIESFPLTEAAWDWDAEFYMTGKSFPLTLYKGVLTVNREITRP